MPIRWMPRTASTDLTLSPVARLALAVALACVPGAAAVAAQEPACDSAVMAAQEADAMRLALGRCQNDATYLARMGHAYLQEQRYAEAAEHLERALLLSADDGPTQLDYALALAGSGDIASALHLIFALERRPDLPEPLRQSLRLATRQWSGAGDAAAQPVRFLRLAAGVRAGYDSNLLGAPQLRSITLTLPGESITLPVDGGSQPRAGAYGRADLRLEHSRMVAANRRWDVQAAVLQRSSPRVSDANSTQAELQLEHTRIPAAPGAWGWYASSALSALKTHGGTRYSSQGVAFGLEFAANANADADAKATVAAPPAQTCTGRLGVDWQNRSLHSNQVLSGRYSGVSALWGCHASLGGQWQLVARAGRDEPQQNARPGGAQDQFSLRAYARRPVGGQGAWVFDVEASHSQDAVGYSPLLDNGRRRRIGRLSVRAEYQQPLAPGILGLVGVEAIEQHANLPLFSLRSQGVYAGLRAVW